MSDKITVNMRGKAECFYDETVEMDIGDYKKYQDYVNKLEDRKISGRERNELEEELSNIAYDYGLFKQYDDMGEDPLWFPVKKDDLKKPAVVYRTKDLENHNTKTIINLVLCNEIRRKAAMMEARKNN